MTHRGRRSVVQGPRLREPLRLRRERLPDEHHRHPAADDDGAGRLRPPPHRRSLGRLTTPNEEEPIPDPARAEARAWTFEGLAVADPATLERLLRAGAAPDFAALEGRIYRGWNHQPITALTGRKFCKGFVRRGRETLGYNQVIRRDGRGPDGDWEPKLDAGRPVELGHFAVNRVADEPSSGLYDRYRRQGLFDYRVDRNAGRHLPLRMIRDFVALPEPDDHELLVGKAYLQLGFRWLNVFVTYFVLGHPRPIEDDPA